MSIQLSEFVLGGKNIYINPSSASNLSNETYERGPGISGSSQQNKLLVQKAIRLEKSLEETKKENTNLNAKVSCRDDRLSSL